MITKIYNKKKLYALIVKNKYRNKKGVSFFSNHRNQLVKYHLK